MQQLCKQHTTFGEVTHSLDNYFRYITVHNNSSPDSLTQCDLAKLQVEALSASAPARSGFQSCYKSATLHVASGHVDRPQVSHPIPSITADFKPRRLPACNAPESQCLTAVPKAICLSVNACVFTSAQTLTATVLTALAGTTTQCVTAVCVGGRHRPSCFGHRCLCRHVLLHCLRASCLLYCSWWQYLLQYCGCRLYQRCCCCCSTSTCTATPAVCRQRLSQLQPSSSVCVGAKVLCRGPGQT